MTLADLKKLAKHSINKTAPENYSLETVNTALADGLKELGGTYNKFMKNKYDIFDLIIETVDPVITKNVISGLSVIAEIQTVPHGQRATFRKKVGRNRAKKFLTQVGLSGVYETFRLDETTFDINAHAVGGATILDWERLMDGSEDLIEVANIIAEGLTNAVYLEVQKALVSSLNATGRPAANKVSVSGFNAASMQGLINVVKSYGDGAVIFAPPEFVGAMGPDAIVPPDSAHGLAGVYDPEDIKAIHNQGYVQIFRGTPIVQFAQSFIDESNTKTWINPQLAYVLPTGRDKIVKVVLEGTTQMNDFKNRDNSIEIHAYRKMGAAILTYHDWGIYQNTAITDTSASPYGF